PFPLRGAYDEPPTVSAAITSSCPTSADGLQPPPLRPPKPPPPRRRDGPCDGADHPNNHRGPRFGCAERATDLPSSTSAFVLRRPGYAYQVARIWQKWLSRRDRGSRRQKTGRPTLQHA